MFELVLVLSIIAMVMALTLPRFLPALAFGELEGSSRHLANYGRSLLAEAVLSREPLTFRVDLAAGEYHTVRWLSADEFMGDEDGRKADGKTTTASQKAKANEKEAEDPRAQEMADQFERFARLSMESRARSVPKDGLLSGIGDDFANDFDLGWEDGESEEEVKTDLLSRVILPDDVVIEEVCLGNEWKSEGEVEVDVSPLGFAQTIIFSIRSGDDYFTVIWDAVTGGSRMREGKPESVLEREDERRGQNTSQENDTSRNRANPRAGQS